MKKLSIYIAFILSLSGCGTIYKFQDKTYTNRTEAESVMFVYFNSNVEKVIPRAKPLANLGRLVIPRKDIIYDRGTTGNNAEARDYVATHLKSDYRSTLEMIKKRGIFSSVVIEESDGDHIVPKENESIVYLYMGDSKTVGWYYVSNKIKRTPLSFDRGNSDMFARIYFLVESVESLSASE
jgi:hypothetical protein